MCAVSFANSPDLAELLSREFATGFHAIYGESLPIASRRTAELTVRRDQLAQELETRIAGERQASKELNGRWRELDRLVRAEQQLVSARETQLQAIKSSLAETDARLRYRRLELNTELRWQPDDRNSMDQLLEELDGQITRWRRAMAELAQREASLRARMVALQSERGPVASTVAEQQAWLAVARQLSADLAGEVSRLARASASHQCVCQDAHPRLRPIAETIQRQLEALASLLAGHQLERQAEDFRTEVENLNRAESELRRHVDHLLSRRQELAHDGRTRRRPHPSHDSNAIVPGRVQDDEAIQHAFFSAADLDQLEQRRIELEQERFQIAQQVKAHRRKLRDLRAQRDTVARQRAELLSARSIEHVQRELADVERKLEQAIVGMGQQDEMASGTEHPSRASDYLAQLTDGKLLRVTLLEQGRRALVTNAAGESLPAESLPAADRDRVYLSFCLALLSAAARQGVWLPLVLDDPFLRLDARATASIAAVLDAFCRQGHQVIVFTGQQAAAERLASLGAAVRDIASLRYVATAPAAPTTTERPVASTHRPQRPEKQRKLRRTESAKRKKPASQIAQNGKATDADRSDAA
jgi:DNA repair exonuclease SbcCD ATPase subunit